MLRVLGNLARNLARVAIALYDIVIVVPLVIERLLLKAKPSVLADDDSLTARRS